VGIPGLYTRGYPLVYTPVDTPLVHTVGILLVHTVGILLVYTVGTSLLVYILLPGTPSMLNSPGPVMPRRAAVPGVWEKEPWAQRRRNPWVGSVIPAQALKSVMVGVQFSR